MRLRGAGIPSLRRLGMAVLIASAALSHPLPALAHPELRSSTPARGAELNTPPRELRLTYADRVELALTHLRLVGPDSAEVALGALRMVADSNAVVAPINGALSPGSYTVRWEAAGVDGHPVRGSFGFSIAAPEPVITSVTPDEQPPAPASSPHQDSILFPERTGFDVGSPAFVLVRWVTLLAMLGVLGVVVFRIGVHTRLPAAAATEPSGFQSAVLTRLVSIGMFSARLLAVAALARLAAQWYALYGGSGAMDLARLGPLLLRTLWGWAWLLQLSAAVAVAAGLSLVTRSGGGRAGWSIAGVAALLLALSASLSGHAAAVEAARPLVVANDTIHVLGAGGWMGGLAVLVLAGIPAAARLEQSQRGEALVSLVRAFSPVALACAAVVTLTGVTAAWIHLRELAALWQSPYGQTLLVKLALLLGVVAAGAYNWLRLKPALEAGAPADPLRRSAALELATGVLVLLVTAVLMATSPPPPDADRASGGREPRQPPPLSPTTDPSPG
ncbi:MAG: copper resistance protein CopC/CopD [Gemmatimonadetes bacterium]|nr:copper resistance protein CopC/CopD [Gemmatimonadota bacterium]